MDERRARELLQPERAKLQPLLHEIDDAALADRVAVDKPGGFSDPAEPLTAETTDDAAASTRDLPEHL